MRRLDGWKFTTNADATWEWACEDADSHTTTKSRRSFPTLLACMADASAHGYSRAEPDPGERSSYVSRAEAANIPLQGSGH